MHRRLPLLHAHRALTLVLLFGTRVFAVDAGTSSGLVLYSDPLYAQCREAEPSQPLDGGWVLLPPARAERVACLMTTCEVDRQAKVSASDAAPPPSWLVVAVTTGVLAAIAGFWAGRASTLPTSP